MVRAPCCDNAGVKRGPWTEDEDMVLVSYIQTNGHGNWRALPKKAGLNRCGKSCRLRWTNYLRPDIKRGNFTKEEEDTIIQLHTQLGNRWSVIAAQLPGRTDNEIKNVWHTYLKKRLPQGSAEPEAAVRRLPKETDLSRPEAPSSTTLVLNQQQQQHSETDLLWLPGAEDEPATSCSSSFSGYSDDLVDLSSFDVTDLDEAFWTEALAMNSALAEDQPGAEWAPYGGTTTATIGCSWLERITATQWSSGGAITGSSAGTSFDDATDFWLRLLAEAGNHQ